RSHADRVPGPSGGRRASAAEQLLEPGRELQVVGRRGRATGRRRDAERGALGRRRGLAGRTGRRGPLLRGALRRVAGLALDLALRSLATARLLAAHAREVAHARHPWHASTAAHLAHHLLRAREPLQELVDVARRDAGAARDARTARPVDDLRVLPLGGRHRADDRLDAIDLALVEVLDGLAHLAHA